MTKAFDRYLANRDYILQESDRRRLEDLMRRLYSENRMSGDDMRNAAQVIESVLGNLYTTDAPS